MKYWPTLFIHTNRRSFGLVVWAVFLLALGLALTGSDTAYAEEENPLGADPCGSCHSPETAAWLDSAHGLEAGDMTGVTGAACSTCHGDYTRGHPEDGVMELLPVDSATCQECHTATYDQWEHSLHAGEGVQCIGCHQVHSQDLRLTDDKLCQSCHREAVEDAFHTAHWYGEVACTNCHMSTMTLPDNSRLVSATGQPFEMQVTSHDFVTVSSQNCLTCHKEGIGTAAVRSNSTLNELHSVTAQVDVLSSKLSATQKLSKSLEQMAFVALGLGIAVGGMMGIVFILFVARYSRKDGQS